MTATPDAPQPIEIVLPIEGMTCASCVNRIERFLRKTPGVEQAAVNLATERATVLVDPGTAGRDELVRAVEAAGYEVRPEAAADRRRGARAPLDAELTEDDVERERAQRTTLIQAVVSIAAALVFMALMFVPQTRIAMEDLNRLILVPATFIQFWAGGRFYRAAWRAARHGSATMDTLVALGTTAAWAYSVVVTLWPEVVHEAGLHPETYFDSADDHHRPRPARPVARGPGEGPHDRARSAASSASSRRPRGGCATASRRTSSSRSSCPATCSASGPATRCRSTACVVEGVERGRRVDAHRRADPGRRSSPATRSSARRSTPPARS